MFQANKNNGFSDFFTNPSDIPVAIFEIHWPKGGRVIERFDSVVNAQRTFVENDDKAVLINFTDIDQFYRVDAVGLLITGNRLAKAMGPILPDPIVQNLSTDTASTIIELTGEASC